MSSALSTRRRPARRPRELTRADRMSLVVCALSSVSLTWLVFDRLAGGASGLGFFVVAYLLFLALYALVTRDRLGPLVAADRVVTVLITSATVGLLIPLLWLVATVVIRGLPALRLSFFTHDQGGITPLMPATAGGGSHAIVGSLQQVGLALVWSVPLAIAAAVFLNETRSRFRRPVRIFVDAMSGLPSVLAGLFVYAVLIIPYASQTPMLGYNGLMASLALSLVMLPTITRTIEVVLRLVPDGIREAGLALGG